MTDEEFEKRLNGIYNHILMMRIIGLGLFALLCFLFFGSRT